jgi:histidine triad (HIT) family protein
MKRDPDCVFCKIVAGEIPGATVYEDEHSLAFLDIGPVAEGHVLLIPKEHYVTVADMPAETVGRVLANLPRLARAIRTATGAEALNILQNNGRPAGQVVPHVHFHLIPKTADGGLSYAWPAGEYPDGRLREVQNSIREALNA